jgi:2-C-methyl-D-erythritol 2,4-cyclodiphosphate synthase
MKTILAEIMKVDEDAVSIKATTSEKIGFVGRKEGIAAYATVLIQK